MTETTPAAAAGTWALGGDLTVPRLGYGAMQLAGRNAFGPPADRERAVRALRRALELGVRHVDTSDYYGPYLVNELIREALQPYPEELVLVTKVGGRRDERGRWLTALAPDELRSAVHDNLRRLGVDRLDVVNLRLFAPAEPLAEQFAVLAELREQGLIRHLGISNATAERLTEAQRIAPVACVQNMYNLAAREDDPLLDRCAEQGVAFVPFFPLGGGFRPLAHPPLDAVAARHGVSAHQVVLGWLLHRSPAVLVIPGSSDPAHVEDNVAAAALALTPADLDELEDIGG